MFKIKLKSNFEKFFYNKIINLFTKKGCKHVSEKFFKAFLKSFFKTSKKKVCFVIKCCIKTNSAVISVKQQKRGNVIFKEIPYFLKYKIRIFYAIKSLNKQTTNLKKVSGKNKNKLLHSVFSSLTKTSSDIFIKRNVTKEALKKKSQAHFRWFF